MKGLLVLVDDPGLELEECLHIAARVYRKKHKIQPNLVQVNTCLLDGPELFGDIRAVPDKATLPFHFLVGVSEHEK
jgi:hypothetical protein